MKKIIRVLISGVLTSVVFIGVQNLGLQEKLPQNISAPLDYVYQLIRGNFYTLIFGILFIMMFFAVTPKMSDKLAEKVERSIKKYTIDEILMYIIGLAIGLGMGNLMGAVVGIYNDLHIVNIIWTTLLYVGLGYSGVYIVHMKKEEIKGWFNEKSHKDDVAVPKLLDTSVIIDGRIIDIIKTRIIEGRIIVPAFVLDELKTLSDSGDKLKREKGRRGLDLLRELQNIRGVVVEVIELKVSKELEVDSGLITIAKELNAKIVTNDFNLNKMAQVQSVEVLNINELANAVKPILLPSEQLEVIIIKEGKEREQGIAYLNDGTMIVVEDGRKYVGTKQQIHVTKVLQTSAGRMIFARIVK